MKKSFIYVVLMLVLGAGCDNASISGNKYSCRKCFSTCKTQGNVPSFWNSPTGYLYRGQNFFDCKHEWYQGFSCAYPEPIADGMLVLVRKGNAYGAFQLFNQRTSPESASFRCWWRTDGKGSFVEGEVIQRGEGVISKEKSWLMIGGPFEIKWSVNTNGKGYIYYDYYPWDKIPENGLRFCVTTESEIGSIDAADKQWEYHSSPDF